MCHVCSNVRDTINWSILGPDLQVISDIYDNWQDNYAQQSLLATGMPWGLFITGPIYPLQRGKVSDHCPRHKGNIGSGTRLN